MNNKFSIRQSVIKSFLILFLALVAFNIVFINISLAQENEIATSTYINLSEEELAYRKHEAKEIAQVVLMAIKNGALNSQVLNMENPPLPINIITTNQENNTEAVQSSLKDVNLLLLKFGKVILIMWCIIIIQFLMIISLFYLVLRKNKN